MRHKTGRSGANRARVLHTAPGSPSLRAMSHPTPAATAALLLALILACNQGRAASSETGAELCRFCAHSQLAAPASPETPDYRKYAPDRKVDILHLLLDITPDFDQRTIRGTATLRFKPIAMPLEELRLDAADLRILSTRSSEAGFRQHSDDREIVFHFPTPIPADREASVTIEYSAEPVKGLYFRTEAMGYPETHLWTQGEPDESRHWFPSFDHPTEKFTSEIICHVPAGMVALSNGRQLNADADPSGLTAFHWLQDKPHVNYLITLVAGRLTKLSDTHRDIPLEFWTIPSDAAHAQNTFRHTKRIMEFLERETGIPYPWAKYAQVTLRDYHFGGMENTSLTTLNARTLFSLETENLFESDSLVAHELAHQWFGDLVTCKDWSHLWLNEGFATFYDWLWQGDFFGREEFLCELHNAAKNILSNSSETRGIVWRKFDKPQEMFNYLAYPKGAWVLHMLRSQLGPDLYRRCIHTYLERNAYSNVTTDQLRSVIEELSGRSFDRFFDQWVYGVGAPALDVSYSWDEKTKLAKVSIKQTQKITEDAPLFQFPLTLRFKTKKAHTDHVVQVLAKEDDFFIPLAAAPEVVRIDPDYTLLAKVSFKPARPMLLAQLADSDDLIGQLHALDLLAERPDKEVVAAIRALLESTSHYSARAQAAELLGKARSEESLAALQAFLSQPDARVRNAVVKALGNSLEPAARKALESVMRSEKNPGILASALRGLAPHAGDPTHDLFIKALGSPSYNERTAEGAISAMRTQDDPSYVPALLDAVADRQKSWPTSTLASALEALGRLQRNETNKDSVRKVLLEHLTNPRERIRTAAIAALGHLEDPRAIPALETFSTASPYKPEKAAADTALEKIRAARRPVEELTSLRKEVSELTKTSRDLRKDVESLQKKLESSQPAPPKKSSVQDSAKPSVQSTSPQNPSPKKN